MTSDTKYEVNAGFFDAIDEDRVYSADDMNRPYRKLISNGVFATPQGEASTYLQVLTADNGMNVIVSAGYALIGDKWFENPSDMIITISQNAEVLSRIDSIIAQVDKTQAGRVGNIVYREGTASSNPVHPDINTEEDIIEFRLADIAISPSCVKITQDLITDCRGSSECPWVTSLIYQVDTSTLYAQWQEAYKKYYENQEATFDTWFQEMKDQLSEDAAGNLQLQINSLKNISELEEASSVDESNVIPFADSNGTTGTTKKVAFKDLFNIIIPKNAGAHNSIYRGKDITDKFYDGTLSTQIANQTFDDIFIGDYIIGKKSGRKYLVADINYRLHKGDTECTTPHVLMIPERTMGFGRMNTSMTTEGAYIGSAMYTSYLDAFKTIIKNDFETSHILTHRNILTDKVEDGYETSTGWYDSTIDLMNEMMVYGCTRYRTAKPSILSLTIDVSQLSLFRLDESKIVAYNNSGSRDQYWLRDAVGSSDFSCVEKDGTVFAMPASSIMASVRPAFLIY